MIMEAMAWLQKQFDKVAVPTFVSAPQEPPDVYYLVHRDRCERTRAEPAPRDYTFGDIEHLGRFVKDHSLTAAAIFCSLESVWLVMDESQRREYGQVILETTDQWQLVKSLAEKRQPFTQKQFVELLRTRLCDLVNEELVSVFRNITWRAAAEVAGVVTNSSQTMGRKIEQYVRTGGSELPEVIVLTLRVYRNFGEIGRRSIRCTIIVDYDSQTISLVPVASDLEAAEADLLADVVMETAEMAGRMKLKVPVYAGSE